MTETHISIGRVKRDISDLVNRVAYGGERIVLTSRGKPKAVIVSVEDYQRLEREGADRALARWEAWLAESRRVVADILKEERVRTMGRPVMKNVVLGPWQSAPQLPSWEKRYGTSTTCVHELCAI